jgi:hypothetical protein
MGSLSASAIYNNKKGKVSVIPLYSLLAWNSESARELLGWVEGKVKEYIKKSCALAGG